MMFNQGQIESRKYSLVKPLADPGKFGASHVSATLQQLELEESLRSF